uniref:Putative carboxylate transporter n=1 Tax=uncultured bacterium Contig19 TaxID=1393523 RepID=W0FGZ6_9BACT|nr:putative carboxylate transporter [uncultured bacterium Contig19]
MAVVWTGIQFNCMNLYAAPVVEDLGISRSQFMLVLSIPGVISAAISLFCFGAIEQRIGIRKMILIGGTLNTFSFLTWTFMSSIWMLYLGGALYGFGCGITAYTCVSAAVNCWFKQRIGTLVGIANALGSAAGIVFAVVIAAFIAAVGWRYSFALCTAISALSVVVCMMLYKGSPEEQGVPAMYADQSLDDEEVTNASSQASDAAARTNEAIIAQDLPFSQALHMPRLWILAIGYLMLGTTTYALMSTLPLFALDLGYGNMQGQVVSASLFAVAAAMVPLGVLCDKLGTKWGIALASVLMAVAALALRATSMPFIVLMLVSICAGAAYSACGVTVGVGVKEALGEVDFSKKLGVCSGCLYVGLALGPAITNLAYDAMGSYSSVLLLYAVFAAVTIALFFAGMRSQESR